MNFLPEFFHCTGPGVRAQLTILVCFRALARSVKKVRNKAYTRYQEPITLRIHLSSLRSLMHPWLRFRSSVVGTYTRNPWNEQTWSISTPSLPPPPWMRWQTVTGSPHPPSAFKFVNTYLYTWVNRRTMGVKCLAQKPLAPSNPFRDVISSCL